jgi:hypothetical protein
LLLRQFEVHCADIQRIKNLSRNIFSDFLEI